MTQITENTAKQIADTILRQLGGNRFLVMTGARNLAFHRQEKNSLGALSFRIPSRFAKEGINYVKISLNPMDLYDISFIKIGPSPSITRVMAGADPSPKVTTVAVAESVYFDMLQSVFSLHTGLDTHL